MVKVPPHHIVWLVSTGQQITTTNGKAVDVWEIKHNSDPKILSDWAKHLRNHYCLDDEIDSLRAGTGHSRSDYLNSIKFPDPQHKPGPSTRSGDFGEIIAADHMEFVLGYWVPRTRYDNRINRNMPTLGCDIIGFKFINDGQISPKDTLAIFEAKAQLTGKIANPSLQNAVDDSIKDQIRKAESLNAIKQRMLSARKFDEANRVERFQNKSDNPFNEISGAVAVFCTSIYNTNIIANTDTTTHPNNQNLLLLVFRGDNLMDLVGELYRRAANEA